MSRPDPVTSARSHVTARFPDAVQAWLAGSVTTGTATETSDLDITVLLAEGGVHRESLEHEGWPAR
jgi:predicted nucleotidyltransferase